ncbi:hypothetical protein BH24GEM3_BH24GEM3_23460 [soil metagenome]
MRHSLSILLLLTGLLAGAAGSLHAQSPPHDARWYTFETPNFRVHYHEGLEPLARRAAERAEVAHALLSEEFVDPPSGRIDLVVSDNVDLSNGYATPFPNNRVVVFTHPPVDVAFLGFFDDWLELLIIHELTHIFHLDHTRGWWRGLRSVFGRVPFLFPQIYMPGWVTEGLATYYESLLTRAGRVRGTQHEMVLRTAILEDAFFPIDRATGSPVTWPMGHTTYIYGSLFMAHLAERHGPERIATFVRRMGEQAIPYRIDAAARRSFGVSFTRGWQAWEDTLRVRYTTLADSLRATGLTEPELLTREGRLAAYPRFAPDGRTLAYAASTGREEPALRLIDPGGSQQVITRLFTLDPAVWLPGGGGMLLAQVQFQDLYRIYADLYRVDPGGERVRLTDGARVKEPDPHPDGRRVVAVQSAPGTNVPVLIDLHTGEIRPLTEPSLELHWTGPRWSPAGDRIAVARWRTGGFYDVVVLDSAGSVLQEVTRDRAVDTEPAWSPDGRYLLFSSDRTGIPNLYAYDLEQERLLQVTNVLTGAFQPDVSPDGRWIAFSYYQADGYYIARIPFDPASWRPAPPVRAAVAETPLAAAARPAADAPAVRYSPLPSLLPTFWLPLLYGGTALGSGYGAALAGQDVIERHLWQADALLYPQDTRLDARITYRYRGWGNPLLDLSGMQEWTVFRESVRRITEAGDTIYSALLEREQRATSSVTFQHRRWRSLYWAGGGGDLRRIERVWQDTTLARGGPFFRFPLDMGALFFGGFSNVRRYGFSISPEDGFLLSFSTEARRYAEPFPGEDDARGYTRVLGRGQAYQGFPFWGFARHVLATRVTGGVETGSGSPLFSVGGISGTAVPFPLGFGVEATGRTFPIRGYPAGVQRGDRALAATAEYRFPLLLVERGVRTLPVFLDRFWGDLFVDAGTAWCAEATCRQRFLSDPSDLESPRPLFSAGAEANVAFTTGFSAPFVLRGGVAMPLTRVDAARARPQLYLTAGYSF